MSYLGGANQNMSTPIDRSATRPLFTALNPGDTSWTCPKSGYYTFTARGPGALGRYGAGSQKTVLLFSGQVVTLLIGAGGSADGAQNGTDTVVTFPSGEVMTAGAGIAGGGQATSSGGDTNVGPAVDIGTFPAASASAPGSALTPGPGGSGGNNAGSPPAFAGGPGIVFIQAGKV